MISGIAIVVLALASIAFLMWMFIANDKSGDLPGKGNTHSHTDDSEHTSSLINHMGNRPTPPPEPAPEPAPEPVYDRTLDEIYADSHDLWVCNYCETMNPNRSCRCAACGHEKNE